MKGLEKADFLQTSLGGVSLQTGCWLMTVVIKPASGGPAHNFYLNRLFLTLIGKMLSDGKESVP